MSIRSISIIVGFCLLITTALTAQDRFKTSSGNVEFYSSTPLEDILATNSDVNAILESGQARSVAGGAGTDDDHLGFRRIVHDSSWECGFWPPSDADPDW